MNLQICYLKIKIDVSCEASVNFDHISQNATPATEFAHCHDFSRGNAIRKKRNTSAAPAMRYDNGGFQIAAPGTKTATHLQKTTQNDFRHVMKHVGMSQSATPATRNEATRRSKPPKVTAFAELAIGTAIRASCDRPRMVADGGERKRNVERTHPQSSDPQSETGTLATHSGKKQTTILKKKPKNDKKRIYRYMRLFFLFFFRSLFCFLYFIVRLFFCVFSF